MSEHERPIKAFIFIQWKDGAYQILHDIDNYTKYVEIRYGECVIFPQDFGFLETAGAKQYEIVLRIQDWDDWTISENVVVHENPDFQKISQYLVELHVDMDGFQTKYLKIFELIAESISTLEYIFVHWSFEPYMWHKYYEMNKKRFLRLKNFIVEIGWDLEYSIHIIKYINTFIEKKETVFKFATGGNFHYEYSLINSKLALTDAPTNNDEYDYIETDLKDLSQLKDYQSNGNRSEWDFVSQDTIEQMFRNANYRRRSNFLFVLAGCGFLSYTEEEVKKNAPRIVKDAKIQVFECNDILRLISEYI